MKKNLGKAALLAVAVMMTLLLILPAFASGEEVSVRVTVVNGTPVLPYAEVTVTDADGDGTLTISDALACAHAAYHKDGAAGYGAEKTGFGLSLTKLWGVENGGSYGYFLNDGTPLSLADPVKDGDRVTAFVYSDTQFFSDTYAFFDRYTAESGQITLTLYTAGYDADWNLVTAPLPDAVLLIDGTATAYRTDAEGKVTFTTDGNAHTVSASRDGMTLVPPVCLISAASAPATGDAASAVLLAAFCSAVILVMVKKHR